MATYRIDPDRGNLLELLGQLDVELAFRDAFNEVADKCTKIQVKNTMHTDTSVNEVWDLVRQHYPDWSMVNNNGVLEFTRIESYQCTVGTKLVAEVGFITAKGKRFFHESLAICQCDEHELNSMIDSAIKKCSPGTPKTVKQPCETLSSLIYGTITGTISSSKHIWYVNQINVDIPARGMPVVEFVITK